MNMTQFKEGATVFISNENRYGVIEQLISDDSAIVKFDDGSLAKYRLYWLTVCENTDDEDPGVSITKDRFIRIVSEKAKKASKGDGVMTTLLCLFGAMVGAEIFGDKADYD